MGKPLHTKNKLQRYRPLFIVTVIAIAVYLIWRTFFSLPLKYGAVAFIFGLFLLLAEYFASFEAVVNFTMLSEFTPPEMPEIPIDWYPHVDICIATHNEPVDLLYTTINGCKFLDYPDKSKIHIHLCDDNARPEMEKLAKDFGIHYWGISNNRDAKGGNLNNAIRQTYAPIVVTLDADMIPRHEFLMKTVPYFFIPKMKKDEEGNWVPKTPGEIDPNEKVGFVQTPQGFYNPDLFQYNLYSEAKVPGEQDFFFREINVARSTRNSTIYAGSNTLIAREALEDVDYIAVDTITEDILTGLRIQKLGYKTYATSELLVQGQAPVSIKGLLNQRERWGRGCIDTMRQEPVVFSGRMTFAQKVNYLTAWVFWWLYAGRAVFLAAPIAVILFNLPVVHAELWQVFVFWIPYFIVFNISLKVMSGDVINQHWSAVADTILFPYLVGPILAEQLGIQQKKFHITDKKVTGVRARTTFIFGVPHLVLMIGVLMSLVIGINRSIAQGFLYNPIILFWLVIGAKNLLFALFFMWGRPNQRLASRFYFSEPIVVQGGGRTWHTVTSDASETGLAFVMDDPEYIPEDTPLHLEITYRGKTIGLHGKVVHVAPSGEKWKYSVNFGEMDDETKRFYREYVYDRHHSLPTKLDPSTSILDDFNLHLGKRAEPIKESMRHLPRVHLDIPFAISGGRTGVLVDFNYRYANVQINPPMEKEFVLQLYVMPGFSLRLIPEKKGENTHLFRVENSEEFTFDEKIAPLLTALTKKSPREKAELAATAQLIPLKVKDIA